MARKAPARKPRRGGPKYPRIPLDAYFTESWCIDWLLAQGGLVLPGMVWEPACGDGALVKALRAAGHQVVASDIVTYGYAGQDLEVDFLGCPKPPKGVRTILTNPPYDTILGDGSSVTAESFLRHALALMEPVQGVVVMLLRHEFDTAARRLDIFGPQSGFARKLVLTRRPHWQARVKNGKWPRFNYSWFVWDFSRPIEPASIVYLADQGVGNE